MIVTFAPSTCSGSRHRDRDPVEVWRASGAAPYRPFFWCVLGELLAATSEWDRARARLDDALQFTADSPDEITGLTTS
jgi:hypothetical protein